jgi:hypothetical protein
MQRIPESRGIKLAELDVLEAQARSMCSMEEYSPKHLPSTAFGPGAAMVPWIASRIVPKHQVGVSLSCLCEYAVHLPASACEYDDQRRRRFSRREPHDSIISTVTDPELHEQRYCNTCMKPGRQRSCEHVLVAHCSVPKLWVRPMFSSDP